MRTFSIETLGCKVNAYESEQLATLLRARGLTPSDPSTADLRIVNTCSVTTQAAKQSRQTIRRTTRLPLLHDGLPKDTTPAASHPNPPNPRAKVLVTGCYATSDPQVVQKIEGVDAVLTHHQDVANELDRLLTEWSITARSPLAVSRQPSQSKGTVGLPLLASRQDSRQRAYLKIQDGCDAHCTYCIIPKLRPTLWSKPLPDLLNEARALVDAGHLELVLTGIFLGAYNQPTALRRRQPKDTAAHFATLIESLCTQINGLRRLRLSSLEPGDLTPDLISVLKSHPQVVPHFHLPLQSGSDPILRRMNRQYTRDDYLRMLDLLHHHYDRPALTTDIIVAFPGESDHDFAQTLDIADRAQFIHTHAFPFSPRPHTAAARWTRDFIAPQLAKQRIDLLTTRAAHHSHLYRQSFLNQTATLLVERTPTPDGLHHGRTERYFDVHFPSPTTHPGDFATIKITQVTPTHTHGTLLLTTDN